MDRLSKVTEQLREFVREREWEQYHDPKNLAMTIASEAGELLADYRWVPNSGSDEWSRVPENRTRVGKEAADVGIALLLFCDRLGIDLIDVIQDKIVINGRNYPVQKSRGRSERPGTGP